ncbi:hypothetical protein CA13_25800 [Planctomycetes bacterium CA13]|uniref:N-acyl amino acid synthase FeeM catalytic core domain-containing protein n=1 Tax=Novipirellula herctigrandis TaxID=2527986 RepID=A0A5C5Z165_9BACT|nr:hypothetical protein CA13_25800 [Planctomycetes bacterium CA13]
MLFTSHSSSTPFPISTTALPPAAQESNSPIGQSTDPRSDDSPQCRTARCRKDYAASFATLYECFHRSDLCLHHQSKMRILPFHLRPETQVFVCEQGGNVCGTISIVLDEGEGMPLAKVFADEAKQKRVAGHRIAELSSLAISPTNSHCKPEAFAKLTSIAVAFARHHGVDELLATVHPRHARIYERVMGFRTISDVAAHGGVLGQPAVLIAAPIDDPDLVISSWHHWYFTNPYSDNDLSRTQIPAADRHFFAKHVTESRGNQNPKSASN